MNLPDDRTPVERRLAGWQPAAPAAGRDRLLFAAGLAAGRRQANGRIAAALLALAIGSTGWAVYERVERGRLELALAERVPPLRPAPIERPPGPVPEATLSQRVGTGQVSWHDPVELALPATHLPGRFRPILTPLSSRSNAALTDL